MIWAASAAIPLSLSLFLPVRNLGLNYSHPSGLRLRVAFLAQKRLTPETGVDNCRPPEFSVAMDTSLWSSVQIPYGHVQDLRSAHITSLILAPLKSQGFSGKRAFVNHLIARLPFHDCSGNSLVSQWRKVCNATQASWKEDFSRSFILLYCACGAPRLLEIPIQSSTESLSHPHG